MPSGERQAFRCPGPLGRRELLRFGVTGFGSIGLAEVLAARADSGSTERKDTAVILVWCHGGPPHLETYDPKPDAPSEFRGPFGAIETNVAGLRYSELMPLQAKIADKTSLIRSVHHRAVCHQQGLQTVLTGKEQLVLKNKPDHPDAFCILNRVRQRPGDRIPVLVGLPGGLPYAGPAYLGAAYEPFVVSGDPNKPNFEVPNLKITPQDQGRLSRRMRLMSGFDEMRRDLDDSDVLARGRHYQAAVDLLTGRETREAFEISRENEKTRDLYGRTNWGQQLLLARRLVEAGVGAVTVSFYAVENGLNGSWDDHAVNADCFKAMAQRGPIFDRAVAGLVRDLYDRGLDKKVLVIVTGEFGRTPRINPAGTSNPGRDHWWHAMSILVSGGGLRMGQVVGATDARGEYVTERDLEPNDLLATMYRHLGVDPRLELRDHTGRPVPILDRSAPIAELV